MAKLQAAVKKETAKVTSMVIVLSVLMVLVMWLLKITLGNLTILGEYNVFAKITMLNVLIGGACGAGISILNFFLMAVTVQAVTSLEDENAAKNLYQKSYYKRLGIQLLWMVAAFLIPVVNPVAGILPLLFPSLGIKVTGIIGGNKVSAAEIEAAKARAEAEAAEEAAIEASEETQAEATEETAKQLEDKPEYREV